MSWATRKTAGFLKLQWIAGHWHPKSNKDCPVPPSQAAQPMTPSGSSGDNSRSAVKSGAVPVRINKRPTFLGASPKWRGAGWLPNMGNQSDPPRSKGFRYVFMSKPVVFGSLQLEKLSNKAVPNPSAMCDET